MSRRADLEAIGLKALHAYVGPGGAKYGAEAIIASVAAMLSAAPAATRKRAKPEGSTLPFAPQAVHQALRDRVGHIVLTDVVSGSVFGILGKRLQSISGLVEADLDHLVSWIEAGGMAGWPATPTFQMVANNIDKYITWAREWDRRGRQPIRKGGSLVGEAEGAGFDMGAFK